MTNESMRHSGTVVVKNVIYAVFIALMVLLSLIISYPEVSILVVVVLVIAIVVCFIYWKRTLITFTDDELMLERDTIFKMKKIIPYSKIASINADRDVLDRIFGTMKLKININSSRNALVPEAILTLDVPTAERIRTEISNKIFNEEYTKEEYDTAEPPVEFSLGDVTLHGLFGLSSWQTLASIVLLAYSLFNAFWGHDLTGTAVALIMLAMLILVPFLMIFIRYYNFKISRVGDTIHLQHGAIQNYRSSFEITRVNAIRVRKPLIPRLMHRSYIEVEVVGLGDANNNMRPIISLLAKDEKVMKVMENIVPEFIYAREPEKQPEPARWPMFVNTILALAVTLPILVFGLMKISEYVPVDMNAVPDVLVGTKLYLIIALAAVIAALAVYSVFLSMKIVEFDRGEDKFTFVNGIIDREMVVMNYDKVQIVNIGYGLIAKRFGLARCRISMLTASGAKRTVSGYFRESELTEIADKMLERVRAKLSF
jgi:Predicted membrane protein